MIISHGRRYIFVHIPKTGGTSLALALEAKAMKDDILIGDTPKALRRRKRLKGLQSAGRLWKHSTLADIDGLLSPAEIDDFLVFTLIRNPWDRIVSYYHWLQVQQFDHPAVTLAQGFDFNGFLNQKHTRQSIQHGSYQSYMRTAKGVERCDLYLRLEHLEEDANTLQTHLEMRLPVIPRANKSGRRQDWRGYYSDADAALIAKICAKDIERFNYGFDD